jgi:hypothetical protein
MAQHEDKTLSGEALIKSAQEKQKNYPKAATFRYDGKQWKRMIKIFAFLNYSVLPKGKEIQASIEKNDETHDIIKIVLLNHQNLIPYLEKLKHLF